jgi:hypothetical protein
MRVRFAACPWGRSIPAAAGAGQRGLNAAGFAADASKVWLGLPCLTVVACRSE